MNPGTMKKTFFAIMAAFILSLAASLTSFAYGWQNNGGKWWYGTNASNSDYYRHTWKCIDGNWYYFEGDGYMAHDTSIGGIYVGHNGVPSMSPLCPDLYYNGMKIDRGATLYVNYCNEYITLRSQPSTAASGITYIPLYSTVRYLGKVSTDFSMVEYGGRTGYVLNRYLGVSRPTMQGMLLTSPNSCELGIPLYNAPSGECEVIAWMPIQEYIAKYSWEHEDENDCFLVEYRGIVGYVKKVDALGMCY